MAECRLGGGGGAGRVRFEHFRTHGIVLLRVELRIFGHAILHLHELVHTLRALHLVGGIVEAGERLAKLHATRPRGHATQARTVEVDVTVRQNKAPIVIIFVLLQLHLRRLGVVRLVNKYHFVFAMVFTIGHSQECSKERAQTGGEHLSRLDKKRLGSIWLRINEKCVCVCSHGRVYVHVKWCLTISTQVGPLNSTHYSRNRRLWIMNHLFFRIFVCLQWTKHGSFKKQRIQTKWDHKIKEKFLN